VPPVTVNAAVYGTFTVPPGKLVVLMFNGGAATLMAKLPFCVWLLLSATRAVKLNEPTELGVPLSTPELDSETPDGKLPDATDQLNGAVPPLAASDEL